MAFLDGDSGYGSLLRGGIGLISLLQGEKRIQGSFNTKGGFDSLLDPLEALGPSLEEAPASEATLGERIKAAWVASLKEKIAPANSTASLDGDSSLFGLLK